METKGTKISHAYAAKSDEEKAAIRERKRLSNIEAWANPEIRAKRLEAMTNARQDPEKQKRFREAILESNKNPEHIAKRKLGKSTKSPEEILSEKEKRSISMKKAWEDPEHRKNMEAGISKAWESLEFKGKMVARAKALYDNPDFIENRNSAIAACHNDSVWKADFKEKVKTGNTEEVRVKRGESIRSSMNTEEYKENDTVRIEKIKSTKDTDEYKSRKDEISQKIFDTKMSRYGSIAHNSVLSQTGTLREEEKVRIWFSEMGHEFKPIKLKDSPFFIDGYCEALNLAFEYCGLYWHNEDSPTPRGQSYHLSKMDACNKQGMRLITIFEDEWITRNTQVKSFLRSVVGNSDRKVFARKCKLKEISKEDARTFLDAYHIQGASNAPIGFGIFMSDELLGVMTFSKHHRTNSGTVLSRLCFKDGVQVVGGASRLFSFASGNLKFTDVISWSDNRWSEGGVYKALGFVCDDTLRPDYTYFKKGKTCRISKQSQMKSKTGCPEGMTEKEWSRENGLSRIWDCGKIRWKWVTPAKNPVV